MWRVVPDSERPMKVGVPMKFSLQVSLACTVSEAFAALHDPTVFQRVSAPFLSFTPLSPAAFPERYVSGHSYVIKVAALGLVPLGSQEINPTSEEEGTARIFRDNGRGLSGSLAMVSTFRHTMTLRPSSPGLTILTDELEFKAGVLTPLMGLGFLVFWWWRHRRMAQLAPQWRSGR